MSNAPSAEFLQQYEALTSGVGVVDVSDRTQIEITGEDRASFLHAFCTNDIEGLEPGTGCEAFLTNAKGKIVGYVHVFRCNQSLVLETTPEQAATIVGHLDRYVVREDVEIRDLGECWGELFVGGDGSEVLLRSLVGSEIPQHKMSNMRCELGEMEIFLRRVAMSTRPNFLIATPLPEVKRLSGDLVNAGAVVCSLKALEAIRIEAGLPSYGQDITDEHLPQEIDRGDQAISLTKGCYLGQETVARIDALGHVNRRLVALRVDAERIPEPGAELVADGKSVGQITSAAWSPRFAAPLALAFVRRGYDQTGATLGLGPYTSQVVNPGSC